MNKTLVSALAILATASAFAADEKVVFPSGKTDISDPESWGGAIPTAEVRFTGKGMRYNANLANVTFAGITCDTGSQIFDLTANPDRKVTVDGYLSFNASSLYYHFLGGEWAVNSEVRLGNGCTATKHDLDVVFSNATVSCSKPGVYGYGNRLTLTGGTKLDCNAVDIPGSKSTSSHDQPSLNNEVVLSDGSEFSSSSYAYIVGLTNTLDVSDSKFTCSKDFVFHKDSVRCKALIKDGGLTARAIIVRGTENELLALNSTLRITTYDLTVSGQRNRVRLQGKEASIQVENSDKAYDFMFEDGQGDEFVLADGAKWSYNGADKTYYLASKSDAGSRSNSLIVAHNSEFNLSGTQFYIGYTNDYGHCVSILDGSKLTASSISLCSYDNSLLVTNGMVSLSGTMYLGTRSDGITDKSTVDSGNRIEIAGAKAKLTTGKVDVYNESILHFAVPADGYEQVPWTVNGKITVRSGCAITIDADAFQAKLNDTTSVVLMTWSDDGAAVNANVLAAANAELEPKKMKLIFDKDNKQLVLRVRSLKPGLTIILR